MRTPARRFVLLVFLFGLLVYVPLVFRFNFVCDDSFISFRYSRHLAMGEGLRFNLDGPPVEGFSNLLWVLVLAPFEAAGFPAPIWSRVLSILCGVILLYRLARFLAVELDLPPFVGILALTFFATLPPLALWSTSGLATLPFTLAMFLTFEAYRASKDIRSGLLAGAGGAILILLRADGFVWAGVLFVVFAIRAHFRDRETTRPVLFAGLVSAMTWAMLTLFRLWYFGAPLPNTFYAKVGLSIMTLVRGGMYLLNFVLTFPVLAIVLVWGTVLVWRGRSASADSLAAAAVAMAVWAYCGGIGGISCRWEGSSSPRCRFWQSCSRKS